MRNIILITLTLFSSTLSIAQWTESPMASCENVEFNRKVNRLLNYSVDVISVTELEAADSDKFILLDTREYEEYQVSRIPGAIYFGYDEPQWELLDKLDKNKEIVVYCSIGYRSEKIGEKLQKKGFTQVRNLYGSIFEWANQGYKLEGPEQTETHRVHTYNKRWSKWMFNEEVEKVY